MWPFLSLILVAILSGILMPIQAGINSQLSRSMGHPLQASLLSFFVGTLSLFLFNLFYLGLPPLSFQKGNIPVYLFFGGVLGAFFVTAAIFLVAKLGALTMTTLFILGQFVAGIIIDHFGFFGVPVQPAGLSRWVGVILISLGIFFIKK